MQCDETSKVECYSIQNLNDRLVADMQDSTDEDLRPSTPDTEYTISNKPPLCESVKSKTTNGCRNNKRYLLWSLIALRYALV